MFQRLYYFIFTQAAIRNKAQLKPMTERQQTIDIPPPKADDGGLLGLLTGNIYFFTFSQIILIWLPKH